MKRSIKLLFGILTAVIITICIFSLCVSAESEEKISASGYFGELNWRFSKDSATLTISGEGRMMNPSSYDYWYTYAPFVRYVVIEEGAENISGDILSHCNMLDWVSIPDSVKEIDENALYLSDLLIIKCNYGSYAASYAENNGINVKYLDIIDYGKYGDDIYWKLDMSYLLTLYGTGVTYKCTNIKNIPWYPYLIDIKGIVVEKGIEGLERAAFYNCSSVTEVSLPEGLDHISNVVFKGCSSLKRITIPEGVETISTSTFEDCISLEEVILPDTLKTISQLAFGNCTSLKVINIPDSVERIEKSAFQKCESLTYIRLSDSLSFLGNKVFSGCISLKEVYLPDGLESFGISLFENCTNLYDVHLPASLLSLPSSTFDGCMELEELILPRNITVIEDWAFIRCSIKDRLILPDSLEKIGCGAFTYCYTPKLVIPPSVNTLAYRAFADSPIDVYISHDIQNIEENIFLRYTGTVYCIKNSAIEKQAISCKVKYETLVPEIYGDYAAVTLTNLECVKEVVIAKGRYSNYVLINKNALITITKDKFNDDYSYNYRILEDGDYSVAVVYYGGYTVCKTVKNTMPRFEEKGLQLKISGIYGAKLIRVAYGDYDTIGQISRAEGERSFTDRDVLKYRSEYTIQFREEGLVTVAILYKNGYIEYYKYNVTKRIPIVTVNGTSVDFYNLNDLKVIRLVQGNYYSSREIKNAPGVVNFRGKDLSGNGRIGFSLYPGTYTFCVQYNDESYNYYNITIE